jgi:hypothetical protein
LGTKNNYAQVFQEDIDFLILEKNRIHLPLFIDIGSVSNFDHQHNQDSIPDLINDSEAPYSGTIILFPGQLDAAITPGIY